MKRFLLAIAFITSINTVTTYAQCTGVTISSVTDITIDSVTFSWTVAGVDTYQYAVLPATSPQPTTGTITTDNSVRAGGLVPGTAHKIWIGTDCGNGVYTTTWTSQTFMAASCGSPGTIDITNIGADTAIVSWTSIAPNATYEYVIDTVATAPIAAGTTTDTNAVLKRGLLNASKYYVFVRTNCGSGILSPWSPAGMFFSGFTVGISNAIYATPAIKAYPNPVSNTLQLQLPQANGQLEIINTLGAIVYKAAVLQTDIQVNMGSYTPGLYFVRFTNGQTSETIRIHKN